MRSLAVEVAVRVLIVDDRAPFREVARRVVDASDGFEAVGEVESGEEAVLAAGRLQPDLVLMDVNLPGIDGVEATRRSRAACGQIVVLLLSTADAEEDLQTAQCGASEYIPKSRFGPRALELAWRSAVVT
ncbi:MAG TPA: response regulator transcription factor [Candidatus Dormibacteraeota bacterium]|nr:response regulator transcription factor [Candidatus Dormibacteraeota bacterium]